MRNGFLQPYVVRYLTAKQTDDLMATQICPNCKADSFTWSIDDDSNLTIWGCFKCRYSAYEDESYERECSNCGKKTESRLEDNEKIYWWCSSCNRITDYE